MKQNTVRILNSCGVAIAGCSIGIYNTLHRSGSNRIDYQLNIDYQAHPVASIIGTIILGIVAGFAFYWWDSRRARLKQKKLSSINFQEAARLAAFNMDDQNADAINGFLRNASARDIQEFIHNVHVKDGYIQRARTAIEIRLAEDAEIATRRIVRLTWALLAVSVGLLAFAIWQTIIIKMEADAHAHQIQADQNHASVKAADLPTSTSGNQPALPQPQVPQNSAWDDLLRLHPEWVLPYTNKVK